MPDVQGRCPACGTSSLFLSEGGHVTCSRTACVAPGAADQLLHGEEAALAELLGGGPAGRGIAGMLTMYGFSFPKLRHATDADLMAVPGIGEESLAVIRRAFPAVAEPDPVAELARLREGLHKFRYALVSRAGRETTIDFMRALLDDVLKYPGEPCDRDEQYARAEEAEAVVQRIRALHRPVEHNGRTICGECSGWDGGSTDNSPCGYGQCSTLRALDNPEG
ncbi:hypothetical protein E4P36_05360 [Streptomyces sp. 4R-3d]|nr:hypothetical protein E4P36_05360 [Streptomyces sp. 4R-3d]